MKLHPDHRLVSSLVRIAFLPLSHLYAGCWCMCCVTAVVAEAVASSTGNSRGVRIVYVADVSRGASVNEECAVRVWTPFDAWVGIGKILRHESCILLIHFAANKALHHRIRNNEAGLGTLASSLYVCRHGTDETPSSSDCRSSVRMPGL